MESEHVHFNDLLPGYLHGMLGKFTTWRTVCNCFSDNYAFTLQDAAQGFHWNNSQATTHPLLFTTGEPCHISYVVIADDLHHETIAIYLFQKRFLAHMR